MAKPTSSKQIYEALCFHLHQAQRAGDQKLAGCITKRIEALHLDTEAGLSVR